MNHDHDDDNDTTTTIWKKRMHESVTMAVPELLSKIPVHSLLVDTLGNLVDRCQTMIDLVLFPEEKKSVLSESVILGMIHAQRHQRPDKRRFQLADILTFFVSLTSHETIEWTKSSVNVTTPGLRTLPACPMDIVVPPCVFIFHSINTIWLIFREEVSIGHQGGGGEGVVKGPPSPPLAISILKTTSSAMNNNKATKSNKKHVRISQELPRYKSLLMTPTNKRKTIKIHH